ncbi:MAG: proton-conducting transporter membrane subunit, partial [Planctomycetota bacterium]
PGLGGRLADSPARELAMLLLFFGLGVKAGVLPLHVWLPLAHPAAPVPASAVLSGAMIKAGLLGWLRLVPDTHGAALPAWGELCLVLGVSAAFFGVVVGLTQRNAKTVLAYSSISQMGLITVAVGLAFLGASAGRDALLPALAYAMHHGLAKGALFLGVGVAAAAHGSTRQRIACGIGLLIPALSLAGMPWTSGALAKALLKADAARAPDHWAVALDWLLPLAAVGTTLLMARFLWLTWPRTNSASAGQCTGMWIGWLLLVAASAGAVFLWPWGSEVSMEKLLLPPEKLLAALWPILVGAAVALLTVIARTRGYRFAVPEIPAGDLLAWIAPAGAGLRRVCSETAAQFPRGAGTWQAARVSNTRPSNTSNASSNKVEILLQQSSVYGALILALVGLLFVLFALT